MDHLLYREKRPIFVYKYSVQRLTQITSCLVFKDQSERSLKSGYIHLKNKVKEIRRMVDALALEDDEGRDERRYASGSSKYAEIRGFPNGATRQ